MRLRHGSCMVSKCRSFFACAGQVLQFEDWMKEEKVNLQKCLPSKERILRMAAYNRIVRSFRSSHFTEELQAHKMWRITNLIEQYDPDTARVPEYKGQFPMFVLPEACSKPSDAGETQDKTTESPQTGDEPALSHKDVSRVAKEAPSDSSQGHLVEQPSESSRCPRDLSSPDSDAQNAFETDLCSSRTVTDAPDAVDAEVSEVEQLEGICVVCIEKSALFVMHECGHLIFCPGCRRKAVAKELKESGKTQWKSVKPGQLSNKELERTKVRCPICREESVAVAQKKFNGKVYT